MKKRIVKVSLVQSGKVIALMYLLLSVPMLALLMLLPMEATGVGKGIAFVAIPLGYAAGGFLAVVFGGWLYNLAAGMVGGIEYTTADVQSN